MEKIKLVDITADNWEEICALYPGKEGRKFVTSNSFSIAQSFYEKGWIIKGITMEKLLIGFTTPLRKCRVCANGGNVRRR